MFVKAPNFFHLLTEKLLLKLIQVRNTLTLKQLHSKLKCSTLMIFFLEDIKYNLK